MGVLSICSLSSRRETCWTLLAEVSLLVPLCGWLSDENSGSILLLFVVAVAVLASMVLLLLLDSLCCRLFNETSGNVLLLFGVGVVVPMVVPAEIGLSGRFN